MTADACRQPLSCPQIWLRDGIAVVGVLIEVPVMPLLIRTYFHKRNWLPVRP